MNKLVIIGNGFDLAHGLPTSYKDFLNHFWKNLSSNFENDLEKEVVSINSQYNRIFNFSRTTESYDDFIKNLKDYSKEYGYFYNDSTIELHNNINIPIFKFESIFFKLINTKNSIQNWVDIENEYYSNLKSISKDLSNINDKKRKVEKLNYEFNIVKKIFEKYLENQICKAYDFNQVTDEKAYYNIYKILKPNLTGTFLKLRDKDVKNYIAEFSFQEDKEFIKRYISKEKEFTNYFDFFKSYLLSFNYTPTITTHKFYLNQSNQYYDISENYIHGCIGDPNNPINFGFGDETDEDYKLIENLNENEFLNNFKSFQYSQTTNYDELLSYIESGKFQVIIAGHSCGLSDRVLLNTIFEHENCRSIKVYYHKKQNGEDNYTDIIQNISRHFNDKKLMRRKIVSKQYCEPLSQELKFVKKEA